MDTLSPMDPEVPVTSEETPSRKAPPFKPTKQTMMLAGIVIVALLVSGSAFYLGYKKQMSLAAPVPTPTPEAAITTPTPEIEEETEDIKPSEEPTPSKKQTPTPTKKPTSTPTLTPTPAMSVTGVTATVGEPANFTQTDPPPCAHTFMFYGSITANGPGTVTYQWERSEGTFSPAQSLTFENGGIKNTDPISWDKSATFSGWMKLHTLTPNTMTSGQVNFSLTCP